MTSYISFLNFPKKYKKNVIIATFTAVSLFNTLSTFAQHIDSFQLQIPHSSIALKKYILPGTLIGLGIYGTVNNTIINRAEIKEERNEYYPNFAHHADNYLQFAPLAATFAMNAFNIKGKHDLGEQALLAARAELIMMAIVYPMKQFTKVVRPDSSSYTSFPSGHTAQAFMAATIFSKEYGKDHPALSAGMFGIAGGIGAFRVLNNKHWVSDVFAGAGIGILSVELAYMIHANKPKKENSFNYMIAPSYSNGQIGCTALLKL